MNWQTALLGLLVVIWAAVQYGLAMHALVDLRRRPSVRGNNKVVWTLVILGIPIVGALVYTVYGPTSFIRRGPGNQPEDRLPLGETTPRSSDARAGRSTATERQFAQPIELLPEIPELADFDGETDATSTEQARRRAANRLVHQAQRKIRR